MTWRHLGVIGNKCRRAWRATRVELHGRYSVGRMKSLLNYEKKTSLTRVLLGATLTPLPCLVAVTIADAIPLQPIELGLAHSQGFWIRCVFAVTIYTATMVEQFRYVIPTAPISTFTYIVVTVAVTALTTLGTFVLSLAIGYPLPFAVAMLSVPWAISFVTALAISLRVHIKQHPTVIAELIQFIRLMSCQVSLVVVYPAYMFVFIQLTTCQQAAFAFVLPVVKRVEKNLMSFVLRNVDDLKPEIIVFNVEVFNAIFVSFCMQGAKSIGANLVLVSLDFFLACAIVRGLNKMLVNAGTLAERAGLDCVNLLRSAQAIAHDMEGDTTFSTLARSERPSHQTVITEFHSSLFAREDQITPFPLSPTEAVVSTSYGKVSAKRSKVRPQLSIANKRRQFLHQMLQILRVTEYVLLIEYTEVVIPIIYSTYITILSCLPNRVYYPQHSNLDAVRLRAAIENVMMNAGLELLSLVILSILIQKKLGLTPLHQISFVLENQSRVVQTKLITWLAIALQSTLIHVGADYSFKFSWLRKPRVT